MFWALVPSGSVPATAVFMPMTCAGRVEERPARVARVDRGVGLDHVVERLGRWRRVARRHGAAERRDDALGHRRACPRRARARCRSRRRASPATRCVRVAEGHRRQVRRLSIRRSATSSVGVRPDQRRRQRGGRPGARDGDRAAAHGRGDHVVVRDDEAVGRDDHPGPLVLLAGALDVDRHDRGRDLCTSVGIDVAVAGPRRRGRTISLTVTPPVASTSAARRSGRRARRRGRRRAGATLASTRRHATARRDVVAEAPARRSGGCGAAAADVGGGRPRPRGGAPRVRRRGGRCRRGRSDVASVLRRRWARARRESARPVSSPVDRGDVAHARHAKHRQSKISSNTRPKCFAH